MQRWTIEQANTWYAQQPWLVGCNFIPSTAINQLEMWQSTTFDPAIIERELGWAANIGMNTVRVYLHDLLWTTEKDAFIAHIHQFLDIAAGKGIKPLFTIFDDCWNRDPKPGLQPEPLRGTHNSGWVQSPGNDLVISGAENGRLEVYVKELLTTFANDSRILMWDLYNEPGNRDLGAKTFPLLRSAFDWAWQVRPSQPLTTGLWWSESPMNDFMAEASDIITFHNYSDADHLQAQINDLRKYNRPLVCTEYMARTHNSLFETCLPVFKRENVGCYNWGLVAGKTNTIFAWSTPLDADEPPLWFHDIFRADGSPYDTRETTVIRQLTAK